MEFVKRNGSELTLSGEPFRFISFNAPNLFVLEDPEWKRINAFEQEDIISSIAQMGGRVTRVYTLSIPTNSQDLSKHINNISGYGSSNATWSLNEDMMLDMDKAIELAEKYNIRIIFPLIDKWQWWGGIRAFASMYGKTEDEFFTDDTVRNGWKNLITLLLDRNNTITGRRYKDEAAIMAWETGNELFYKNREVLAEWTLDTVGHIKSIDSNHLVIDGSYGIYEWDQSILESSNIDMLSNHYYIRANILDWMPMYALITAITLLIVGLGILANNIYKRYIYRKQNLSGNKMKINPIWWITSIAFIVVSISIGTVFGLFQDISPRLIKDMAIASKANKALLIGEIGFLPNHVLTTLLASFVSSQCTGILLWSLRSHSRRGGFYVHEEKNDYYSYHYPGFDPAIGFGKDEKSVFAAFNEAVIKLGAPLPKFVPNPPVFLKASKSTAGELEMSWLGTAGSSSYSIVLDATNEVVVSEVQDNVVEGTPILVLDSAVADRITSKKIRIVAYGAFGNVSSSPAEIIVT